MRTRLIFITMLSLLSYTQAGAQWQKMQKDTALFGNFYSAIHFVSDSVGFLVGCSGKSSWDGIGLFKTKNAGTSWSYIQGASGPSDCRIPNSFVNENAGYCILSHGTLQPNDLVKTSNGGVSWNNLMPASGLNLGDQYFEGMLYFVDGVLGFATKSDTLYRTSDGGINWQHVSTGHFIKTLFFTAAQTGYAAGDNNILKTIDGGNNWQVVETNYSITSLSFSSANVGYGVGVNGTIVKTIDAGNTWSPQVSGLSNSIALNAIVAVNDYNCFAVGDNGTILNTSNGGTVWVSQNSGVTANLTSISSTKTHCYAVGDTSVILTMAIGTLGIQTPGKTNDEIIVSPNPFSKEGFINIKMAEAVASVRLSNIAGREFQMSYSKSAQQITISRDNLPAGIYLIRLIYNDGTMRTGKVVITD